MDAGEMPLCPHLLQLVIITYMYYHYVLHSESIPKRGLRCRPVSVRPSVSSSVTFVCVCVSTVQMDEDTVNFFLDR